MLDVSVPATDGREPLLVRSAGSAADMELLPTLFDLNLAAQPPLTIRQPLPTV